MSVVFPDPRNMVAFGVVTDVRIAKLLGFNSSATALMLRPFSSTLVGVVSLCQPSLILKSSHLPITTAANHLSGLHAG